MTKNTILKSKLILNSKLIALQSLEYYSYLIPGKEYYYKNPNPSLNEIPYLKGKLLTKNMDKKECLFSSGVKINFNEILNITNETTININDMTNLKEINEMDILYNLWNRYNEKEIFTYIRNILIFLNPFEKIEGIYNDFILKYYIEKNFNENNINLNYNEPHIYDIVINTIKEILKDNCKNQSFIISGESGSGKSEIKKHIIECIIFYFKYYYHINNNTNNNSNHNNYNLTFNNSNNYISNEYNSSNNNSFSNDLNIDNDYYLFNNLNEGKNNFSIEEKILYVNIILEAFGNAKTIKNINSSRFGKYIKIKFDKETNIILGAEIKIYLLEKYRITNLNINERNFHIFYYLLNYHDLDLLNKLYLINNPENYKYLNKGKNQIYSDEAIDDKNSFENIIKCFILIGFSKEEINTIFKIISAILLLGNINFKNIQNQIIIESKETFENICNLLSINSNILLLVLTKNPSLVIGKDKILNYFSEKDFGNFYSDEKMNENKDFLAIELYNKLFYWIILKINHILDIKDRKDINNNDIKYISILDFFGFENIEKNSIEQLCINYSNEQIQNLYLKDIFEKEKEEFIKEGLKNYINLLNVNYNDNKDIIRCIKFFIDKSKDSNKDENLYTIASELEKEIDTRFFKSLKKVKENKFVVDKLKKEYFTILHSHKKVSYYIKNWIKKNKDEIEWTIIDCLLNSKNEIIRLIFSNCLNKEEFENEIKNIFKFRNKHEINKIPLNYIGIKFKREFKLLKDELKICNKHYIRCIKPNEINKPFLFIPGFVFNQIKYLEILETIKSINNGFIIKRFYNEFYNNYKIIYEFDNNTNYNNEYYINKCKVIIKSLIYGKKNFEKLDNFCLFGNSKIYMKESFHYFLENEKKNRLKNKIDSIKIIMSSIYYLKKKNKIVNYKKNILCIQNIIKLNNYKLSFQGKKNKIDKIQSLIKTNEIKNSYQNIKQNYTIIQNSLKILLAKNFIKNNKKLLKFLSYRIKIYIKNKKKELYEYMNNVSYNILIQTIVRKKIVQKEKNEIWKKLNPYFISLSTRIKNKKIFNYVKKIIKLDRAKISISVFQMNLLFKKIENKKNYTKFLFNYSTSRIFEKYYSDVKYNSLIILKYLRIKLNQIKSLRKVNDEFFKNYNLKNNTNDIINNINLELFPNKLNNESINQLINNNLPKKNYFKKSTFENYINYKNDFSFISKNENENKENNKKLKTSISQKNLLNQEKKYSNLLFSIHMNKKNLNQKISINKEEKEIKEKIPNLSLNNNKKDSKIFLFAKIIDFDILGETKNEIFENWENEYNKIFKLNLQNKNPIQLIFLSDTHTLLLNNKGHIFTFGWNENGQCGINPYLTNRNYILENLKKKNFFPILNYSNAKMPNLNRKYTFGRIENCLLGNGYTILLNKEGNLFGFGNNENGELGFGNNKNEDLNNRFYPKIILFKNNFLNNDYVKYINSTGNMNIILTNNSEMYLYLISKKIDLIQPRKLYFDQNIQIKQISCGKNFYILLDKNGILYSAGTNYFNECGNNNNNININNINNNENNLLSPKEIIGFRKYNDNIIQIKCGFKHVICLSNKGNVYTFGNNSFGQLGIKNKNYNDIYKIDKCGFIIQINAGFRNSIIMNDKREIYYFGILSEENKNLNGEIKMFNFNIKNLEIANLNQFQPVRILSKFNSSFSIFYVTFADIRNFNNEYNNQNKIYEILNLLSKEWLDENIKAPYIKEIINYFDVNYMYDIKEKK